MNIGTLTEKGQITIPKEIRNALRIGKNSKVMFIKHDGEVMLKPIKGNIFDLRGNLKQEKNGKAKMSFDDIRRISRKKISEKIIGEYDHERKYEQKER